GARVGVGADRHRWDRRRCRGGRRAGVVAGDHRLPEDEGDTEEAEASNWGGDHGDSKVRISGWACRPPNGGHGRVAGVHPGRRRYPPGVAGHDPHRSYPRDLAARVRESWPSSGEPLPACLDHVLDTAYHASFLRDEERPVTCRILVASPSSIADGGGPPDAL